MCVSEHQTPHAGGSACLAAVEVRTNQDSEGEDSRVVGPSLHWSCEAAVAEGWP